MLRIFLFILLCNVPTAHAAAVIMVFGDSLSAGYGVAQGVGWVDLLRQRIEREKYGYKVVNASLSGETTVGGRNRIVAALTQHKPEIVVLELGGNDGLRGARIETIRNNLAAMIAECRAHGARVLLVGMHLPPNYGSDYVEKFRQVYTAVAKSQRAALVPFLFEGFAANPGAFQSDGIHPNASVQMQMLDAVWAELRPLLGEPKRRSASLGAAY